jgi:hypothetical protein
MPRRSGDHEGGCFITAAARLPNNGTMPGQQGRSSALSGGLHANGRLAVPDMPADCRSRKQRPACAVQRAEVWSCTFFGGQGSRQAGGVGRAAAAVPATHPDPTRRSQRAGRLGQPAHAGHRLSPSPGIYHPVNMQLEACAGAHLLRAGRGGSLGRNRGALALAPMFKGGSQVQDQSGPRVPRVPPRKQLRCRSLLHSPCAASSPVSAQRQITGAFPGHPHAGPQLRAWLTKQGAGEAVTTWVRCRCCAALARQLVCWAAPRAPGVVAALASCCWLLPKAPAGQWLGARAHPRGLAQHRGLHGAQFRRGAARRAIAERATAVPSPPPAPAHAGPTAGDSFEGAAVSSSSRRHAQEMGAALQCHAL